MSDKTIVHEWFDQVWNSRDADAIDRMLAADAVVHGLKDPEGNNLVGPAGFRPLFHEFTSAFPDMRIEVEDCMRDGDRLAFRCTVRGTHLGNGLGLKATGRPIEISGMGWMREVDGKIAEAWNVFDFQGLGAQLAADAAHLPLEARRSTSSDD